MSRSLHFVGSLPPSLAPDAEAALRTAFTVADQWPVTAVPCDSDPVWIIDYLRSLADRTTESGEPVFTVVRPGDYRDYASMRVYGMAQTRTGGRVTLQPEHVSMNRVENVRSTIELFRKLRAEDPGRAQLRHQISLPSPLDLALFVFFGPPYDLDDPTPRLRQALRHPSRALAALRHLPVFNQAALDEITDLCATDAFDIVFQYETPAVLVALGLTPRPARRRVASLLAAHTAHVLTSAPATAKFVLHLCHGDLGNVALVTPHDLGDAVLYLNDLARRLRRAGRPLPAVHIPAAHGDQPPSTDPAYYHPLHALDSGYALVAGITAEHHSDAAARALALFEAAAGRTCAVATSCGLGRHTAQDAIDAIDLMGALAAAPVPAARRDHAGN